MLRGEGKLLPSHEFCLRVNLKLYEISQNLISHPSVFFFLINVLCSTAENVYQQVLVSSVHHLEADIYLEEEQ